MYFFTWFFRPKKGCQRGSFVLGKSAKTRQCYVRTGRLWRVIILTVAGS